MTSPRTSSLLVWHSLHNKFKLNMPLIALTCTLLLAKCTLLASANSVPPEQMYTNVTGSSTPASPASLAGDVNDKSSSLWTQLGSIIKNILGAVHCSSHASEIMERITWCWDNFDRDSRDYSQHELVNGAGCCLYGQFKYCVNERVKQLCIESAANVTSSAVDYLRILMNSNCMDDSTPYPSNECDAILFPSRTIEGIFGLIIAVSVFTLIILSIAVMVIMISKRSKHREHYQALWLEDMDQRPSSPANSDHEIWWQ